MVDFTRRLRHVFPFFIILFLFFSCRKFEGDQTVPAYITIDSLTLFTNYETQGANSQKILNVWIYVDADLAGIYELPVFVPVLTHGKHNLTLEAGINMNGISATRVPYPMYRSINQEVNFTENQVININGGFNTVDNDTVPYKFQTTYQDNCKFIWMEDFEDPSISLDSIVTSKTNICRTTPADNPAAFLSEHSKYSGYIKLDSDKNFFRIATNVGNDEGFELPQGNNWPIFLEFNFKCNNVFTIGIYANEISQVIRKPILNLLPTSTWNKIYVNLKPIVNSSVEAVDFNIFFEGYLETGINEAEIYLDNIKLIYRSQ